MRRFCSLFSSNRLPLFLFPSTPILIITLIIFVFPYGVSQYRLESQSDVDNFNTRITHITGFLSIGDDQYDTDITDLSPLLNIERIDGNLNIRHTQLKNLNGLENITHLGSSLVITYNPNLIGIDALSNINSLGGNLFLEENHALNSIGLSALTTIEKDLFILGNAITDLDGLINLISIGEDLHLQGNPLLTSTKGLKNLTSIGGYVKIDFLNSLIDVDGLLKLNSIKGNLEITRNAVLPNIDGVINVTSIEGDIEIENNNALETLNGLSNLIIIDEDLSIRSNDALTNLDPLSKITVVGSSLYVRDNEALTNLDGLGGLTRVLGNLRISGNDALTNLDGLASLLKVDGYLRISQNDELSDCCGIQHLLMTPDSITDYIQIEENPSACSSLEEATEASCGPCWSNELLEFCVVSGEWEPVEGVKNQIKSSDVVSMNDFLFFDGSMTIDTVELQIIADGEFYVDNIPIPGGGVGKYFLSKGSYDLKFLGTDGTITNFLNAEITERTKMFETELNLDKLQLVKTDKEIGLKVTCTIKVPGISGGCDDGSGTNTEIQLEGLSITNSGISLDGINIKDLGMYVPKFCLKELKLSYDSQKDILTAGAGVSMPLGEVAGGLKLEEGLIDSIGWLIEASVAPFVLGATTVGIKGFFGHISNITKPAIEVELGGIFSDIISDDLYRITASGKTIWPKYFEIAGTGQFMRPIINTLPFQLQGGVSLGYNIPNKLFNIKVDGKFGTSDEQNWLMNGDGLLRVNHRTEKTKFNGYFNGMMNVTPEVFINEPPMPLPYVISLLGLPFSSETKNTIHYGDRKNFFGYITLDHYFLGKYKLNYMIDLTLPMDDPDYFFWDASKESAVASSTRSQAEEIVIPEHTEHTIIHVKSEISNPTSSIVSPSGKSYAAPSEEDLIMYSEGVNGKESFWTIMTPEVGTWSIELENGAQSDEVFYYNTIAPDEFRINVKQDGNAINVSWDPTGMETGEMVNVLLNDNNDEFNGFRIAEVDATDGSVSFTMDHTLPDCQYFLYAELVEEMTIQQVYSDVILYNAESTLAPPQQFKADYVSESEGFDLSWIAEPSEDITGYIITVIDEVGNDSVYAVLYPTESAITLLIEEYENKSVRIESYDEEGRIGCPAIIPELSQNCNTAATTLAEFICPGESFTVGNSVYTEAGEYIDVFTTGEGCDSTVYLNLSVISVDNNVSIVEDEIVAAEENATSYQWINCDSGEDIDGANQQSFMPTVTGNYAVQVMKDGCEVTSECVLITTSVEELKEAGIIVYPNPARDEIKILNRESRKIDVNAFFYDVIGRRSIKKVNSGVINTSDLSSGMYILVMEVDGKQYQARVVILE
ncbi:MAG: T9SS type A sorting domain-containing protein [Saprospiraceae bacterium]|nr:T9SS type A sorting domain-containing protein [Saprospiraceae bacterium]